MSDRFGWTNTSLGGALLGPGTELGEFQINDHALLLGSQDSEVLVIEGSLRELAAYLRDLLEQVSKRQQWLQDEAGRTVSFGANETEPRGYRPASPH